MTAVLLCLEGSDGVGKCTQACLLANRFADLGKRAKVVSAPIPDSAYYGLIHQMLLSGEAKNKPDLFQVIQVANRLYFQEHTLPKLQAENDYVIFDRWNASAWAYGLAIGADPQWLKAITEPLVEPVMTVVIDGPCHRTLARDEYEKDSHFQSVVRNEYRKWAENRTNATIVDGGQSIREVANEIWTATSRSSDLSMKTRT